MIFEHKEALQSFYSNQGNQAYQIPIYECRCQQPHSKSTVKAQVIQEYNFLHISNKHLGDHLKLKSHPINK